MKCCDADGVCTGGADCLAGPATVAPPRTTPRSCEALGVCQHTEQECPGACRQTPALPVQFAGDEPDDDYDPGTALLLFIDRALLACTIGVTLGALYGAARWVGWAP